VAKRISFIGKARSLGACGRALWADGEDIGDECIDIACRKVSKGRSGILRRLH
jgi:hypothetical protein